MRRYISFILIFIMIFGVITMTSCSDDNKEKENKSETETEDGKNIALGRHYYYDFGITVKNDDNIYILTDGNKNEFAEITTSLDTGNGYEISAKDWYGNTKKISIDNTQAAISVDLGFVSEINGFDIYLKDYKGGKCEIFYSDDGYNYSYYLGEYGEYDENAGVLSADIEFEAKSIMFVLPIDYETTLKISEIVVNGKRNNEIKLLSVGATYTWGGSNNGTYKEDGTKLTDGKTIITDGVSAVAGKTDSEFDELTGKYGDIITFDLGSVQNVSELYFGFFTPGDISSETPSLINVRVSEDGENYTDLGQSRLMTSVSAKGNASKKFCVTRNNTVKARFVRLYTYLTRAFFTDEVYIYGSDTEVKEPEYDFINRKNEISNSDSAAFCKAEINGKQTTVLTDLSYSDYEKSQNGENQVKITLNKTEKSICSISIVHSGEISDISVKSESGEANEMMNFSGVVSGKNNEYVYFEPISGKDITISFSGNNVKIYEVSVYAEEAALPVIKGGFFQLTTAASSSSTENSEYAWYLQLKGMKDLGMDYVVVQYATKYTAKTTLINGKKITSAGYKYTGGYGTYDVCEAIYTAADKLGMKVYVGTVHDSDFTSPNNDEMYDAIVKDSYLIIDDILEMYGSHKSFAGFYLSDEECDQWLNMSGGVEAGRKVYKGQSDYIRKVAPNAKIMIAPAIWRSGDAETGADNLYRLIKSETENGKPIVDIVAVQDCLGRLESLTVDDATYASYEKYVTEWAKAIRRAGAEFWHDAEVFEIAGNTKNTSDLEKSLLIEAKYSLTSIVFDIPHYFTTYPMTAYNDVSNYQKRLVMRDYVRYYAKFASLNKSYKNADMPNVETNDGKKVDTVTEKENKADAKVYQKRYNDGIITKYEGKDNLNWQKFNVSNNKATPEYAYAFDNNNFYISVKTNDLTDDWKNGVWWNSQDDLLQIWLVSTGETASDASAHDYGLRMYLHRKQKGFEKGGTASKNVDMSKITYEYKDGVFFITMPWNALGINSPEAGSGMAMGIVVQYIDGSDQSWASSEGSKGTGIAETALYSY